MTAFHLQQLGATELRENEHQRGIAAARRARDETLKRTLATGLATARHPADAAQGARHFEQR